MPKINKRKELIENEERRLYLCKVLRGNIDRVGSMPLEQLEKLFAIFNEKIGDKDNEL